MTERCERGAIGWFQPVEDRFARGDEGSVTLAG
jgi:hypothetical protein